MTTAERPASFDAYLKRYGQTLGRKAVKSLAPLYIAERDGYPDFGYVEKFNPERVPFEPQGQVIAAAGKMLTQVKHGVIVGEMGVGKSIMGLLSIHEHAKGRPYRSLVLCPDHLIPTWEQELRETIPGVIIHRFENWKAMIGLFESGRETITTDKGQPQQTIHEESISDSLEILADGSWKDRTGQVHNMVSEKYKVELIQSTPSPNSGKLVRRRKRWTKPIGPTWYILGRNQAKFLPDKQGVGTAHAGYHLNHTGEGPAQIYEGRGVVHRVIGHEPMTDGNGKPVLDQRGEQVRKPIIDSRMRCPSCGMEVLGPKGVAMSIRNIADRMPTCKGHYLQGIPRPLEGSDGKMRIPDGTDRLQGSLEHHKSKGKTTKVAGHEYRVVPCDEPLWNFTRKPYRYAPANIIQRKLRGLFEYLVIDEVHEHKSDESAQSMAAGKLMGVAKHILALTGTLIGGYAHHLFPLLLRLSPGTIRKENFRWGCDLDWSEEYGRVDRIQITKQEAGSVGHVKGQVSMRKARTGDTQEKFVVRPGVMPTLYGKHMLGNTIFIRLDELSEELPDMNEYVGGGLMEEDEPRSQKEGECDEDYITHLDSEKNRYLEYKNGYFETAVDMDLEMEESYRELETDLVTANKELLARGSLKLMGTMLWTTMDYPDMPYGWRGEHPGLETVGYYLKAGDRTADNFVGVTSPVNLDEAIVRPKEQRLIDICLQQKSEGRQTWIYVNMSGKRNIQPRLAKLLKAQGLKVCVLKSSDVPPIERKEWIDENGPKYDVIISNPMLVATGLTLFSRKEGGHNFSTLIFYETGYNLFTLRQAARRAWRIGQPLNCRVYYMYYRGTMQHRGMQMMSKKMAAAAAVDGEFSAEGLVGMMEDDSAAMALAKSLKESIDDADTARGWAKLKGRTTPKKPQLAAKSNVLELLGLGDDEATQGEDAMRLVGKTMMDHGVGQEELDKDVIRIEETTIPEANRTKRTRTKKDKENVIPMADEGREYRLPAISREQLAAMFRNLEENGMTLEDFN